MKHILTGEELTPTQVLQLIDVANKLKKNRGQPNTSLAGKHLALMFDKLSLRTRVSFTVGMRELGGEVVETIQSTRKPEPPEDHAQVLSGYCHAIMIRSHSDENMQKMAAVSKIPIINGLSDNHHPCQIFSDLLTLAENFGSLQGLTLTYIGDGNNMLHSLLLLAPQVGVNIHYCCPAQRQPAAAIVAASLAKTKTPHSGQIKSFATPAAAVANADAVYTDVWTSMGFEGQCEEHLFAGYQVNEALMAQAKQQTIFMHCLPMERGKEVSASLANAPCSVIYQQSENRMHMQKALLLYVFDLM